jgi:type IV pilus assembly protein PilV
MRRQGKSRGYTIVELMMALAIFAIGITGIVAMQTMAAVGNMHAKNLAIATALARSWQERLAMDATLWGGERDWLETNTVWIDSVATSNNAWILPSISGNFGPAAGALGDFVDHTAFPAEVAFCTHIRLTRLVAQAGSGLVRTEVRVFWPKGESAWLGGSGGTDFCVSNAADIASIGAATDQFHFVYKTTAVRQTPFF